MPKQKALHLLIFSLLLRVNCFILRSR